MSALVDLRSDTVTRPTAAMRARDGERRGRRRRLRRGSDGQRSSRSASPSCSAPRPRCSCRRGTMANQIALRAQTRPGDEVIIGDGAHCWRHESGALAALAGAQTQVVGERRHVHRRRRPRRVQGRRSVPVADARRRGREHAQHGGRHRAGTARSSPRSCTTAHAARHGARTSTARGCGTPRSRPARPRRSSRPASTRSACACRRASARRSARSSPARATSSRRATASARCTAAACARPASSPPAGLYALEHHRARLAEDHANARALAEALAGAPGLARRPRARPDQHRDDRSRARHRPPRSSSSRARQGVLLGADGRAAHPRGHPPRRRSRRRACARRR